MSRGGENIKVTRSFVTYLAYKLRSILQAYTCSRKQDNVGLLDIQDGRQNDLMSNYEQ